jgi:hypothetical protein
MALLLDRFGDNAVLEACADRLEDAVARMEQRVDALSRDEQTKVLKDLTERLIEVLGRAENEVVSVIERAP